MQINGAAIGDSEKQVQDPYWWSLNPEARNIFTEEWANQNAQAPPPPGAHLGPEAVAQ